MSIITRKEPTIVLAYASTVSGIRLESMPAFLRGANLASPLLPIRQSTDGLLLAGASLLPTMHWA